MTPEQYADYQRRQLKQGDRVTSGGRSYVLASKPNKSKYRNVRAERNGEKFDSKLEANRFDVLKLRQQAGEIRDLRAHVSFPLMVGDALIGAYEADAVYVEVATGRKIVEDSKGVRTPLFRWKARHFKVQYGFAITEVRKS